MLKLSYIKCIFADSLVIIIGAVILITPSPTITKKIRILSISNRFREGSGHTDIIPFHANNSNVYEINYY
jgi:hypothetical protein